MARPDALPGIAKDGAFIPLSTSPVAGVIPTSAAGRRPDYVYVAVTTDAHFLLGTHSVGSASTASMLINAGAPLVLHARQFTSFSARSVTGTGSLVVTPLES